MKIKFLARSASAFGNYVAGDIAELPSSFAMSVVRGGFADLIGNHEPETATNEPAQEEAVISKPTKKRGRPRKKK